MSTIQFPKNDVGKNFGLTEIQFQEMVNRLKSGDDSLFQHVFLTHFKSCLSYLKSTYNASHEDAYDASMDTLVEFHRRLKENKISYGNLRFLFTRMAGQVYFKWIKKQNLNDSIEGFDLEDEPSNLDEENLEILNKAWDRLGEKCQDLLKGFYYEKLTLKEIAEQVEKSHIAVRKQKERCVNALRQHFNRWFSA